MQICICNNFNETRLNEAYANPLTHAALQAAKGFQEKCDILYRAASGGEDPACRTCFDEIEARIEEFVERHERQVTPPEIALPVAA